MPSTLVLLPDEPRLVTSVISPTVIVCDPDPEAEPDDELDDADDELEDGPDDVELVVDDFDDELQAAATMATHAAAASILALLWIMVMCPSVGVVVDRCSRRAQLDAVIASPR